MRSDIAFTVRSTWLLIAICLCIATLHLPVLADTEATLVVADDRTTYQAQVSGYGIDTYAIIKPGFLGEQEVVEAVNVTITSLDDPSVLVSYTEDRGIYRFNHGNYTISYEAPVITNEISLSFLSPVDIIAIFPPGADLSSPLLATMQPMASSLEIQPNNSTVAAWKHVRQMSVRFSDEKQVHLLWMFVQFLIIVAVMMLLPFFFAPREEKMKIPPKQSYKRRR